MQPHVTRALHDWHAAWTVHERAAQDAMAAAFPALKPVTERTTCCTVQMRWEKDGEGSGLACLDDHGRATIEFKDVPQEALGQALDEVFGHDWFDAGPEGIRGAPPGTYNYDDDATYAEYEIDVHEGGRASFGISYVTIEDIVTILDELETALAAHRNA
ncbi:hypothetical protein [Streptomyces griseus]|uniref:hypothetical protein n=1 Tax=Streptomyces griseus TaxID=1911 RepID=UPI0037AC4473